MIIVKYYYRGRRSARNVCVDNIRTWANIVVRVITIDYDAVNRVTSYRNLYSKCMHSLITKNNYYQDV